MPGLPPWQDWAFFQTELPLRAATFVASGQVYRKAANERAAMDLAYRFHRYLPLPASSFVNFDLGAALSASRPRLVVAEMVVRVPDHNRAPHCRIDFFCYMPTGEVVRYHPGRSREGDMQPHSMPPGCNLFDVDLARVVGVGAALHRQPPRLQASSGAFQPGGLQPGPLLCTREDMDAICTYDIHQVSWRQVRDKLAELDDFDQQIDWRDGKEFPRWVWLCKYRTDP